MMKKTLLTTAAAIARRARRKKTTLSGGLDHVCVVVSDVEKSIEWYGKVLGFTHRFEKEACFGKDPAFLQNGTAKIALLPLERGRSPIRDHRGAHAAFGVNREEFDTMRKELPDILRKHAITPDQSVDIDEQDYDLQLSLFFSDPDRNILEITTWVDRDDSRRF